MFPNNWTRQCELIADRTTQPDFPALFTVANLPPAMFDADGLNPALNGGGDIRFSLDQTGKIQLPCEVVSFVTDNNPANGTAQIYVKVPATTSIWIWWGSPGQVQPPVTDQYGRNAVWSEYLHVYHLDQAPAGISREIIDSTGRSSATGLPVGSVPIAEAGNIGNRINFDGINDIVSMPDIPATSKEWVVPGQFTCTGMSWNSTNNVFAIVDWDNGDIVETDVDGNLIQSINLNNEGGGTFCQGLAWDISDNTYWICSYFNNEIRHYNRSGVEITADAISLGTANGVAYRASTDKLYAMNNTTSLEVKEYDASDGTPGTSINLSFANGLISDHIYFDEETDTFWVSWTDEKTRVYKFNGTIIGTLDLGLLNSEASIITPDNFLWATNDSGGTGNKVIKYDTRFFLDRINDYQNGVTVSCWVDPNINTGTDCVWAIGEPIRGSGMGLYGTTTSGTYRIYVNATAANVNADKVVGAGEKFLTYIYDPILDEMSLYSSGVIVGPPISTASIIDSVQAITINIGNDAENRAFDCSIDELRIFNGVASSAWITDEYDSQATPNVFWTAQADAAFLIRIALVGDSIIFGKSGRRKIAEYMSLLLPSFYDIHENSLGGLRMDQLEPLLDTALDTHRYAVFVDGGLNDINESVDRTVSGMANYAIANFDSYIDLAKNHNPAPDNIFYLAVTPWSIGDDDENEAADLLNAHAIATPGITVINVNDILGEYRATGPPGNVWDAKFLYHHDGVHQRGIGARVIAEAFVEALGETVIALEINTNYSDSFNGSGMLNLNWSDWLYWYDQSGGQASPYTTLVSMSCLHNRNIQNAKLRMTCSLTSGFAGIVFRSQDSDNYYRWEINNTAGFARFLIVEGGVATTLKTFASSTSGTYDLLVEIEDSTFKCYIDGILTTTEVDTTYSTGFVGFRTLSSGVVDSFGIEPLTSNKSILLEHDPQLSFADHLTDFITGSPHVPTTIANSLIIDTPKEIQIDLGAIISGQSWESDKTISLIERLSSWPERWVLGACIENVSVPTQGGTYDFYWNTSPSSVGGTGNSGNISGTDGQYVYTKESLERLIFIGQMSVNNQIVNKDSFIGVLDIPYFYGSIVVVNNTDTNVNGLADESHVTLTPVSIGGQDV